MTDSHARRAAGEVMALLGAGIPLSLLCDLVSTADPGSAAVSLAERPAGDHLLREAAGDRSGGPRIGREARSAG